ncbi:MAG TPA: glycoside hydrolase family 31 protein [Puia sp.]|nr:glycoside hydrolase family 31 protein [Puia sp.]
MLTTCFNKKVALFSSLLLLIAAPAFSTVKSWQKETNGVSFVLDVGEMKIRVCAPDVVEVQYSILPRLQQRRSLVITNPFSEAAPFTVSETAGSVVIVTKQLRITVDKATNAITYSDAAGKTILAEDPKDNKSMQRAVLATSIATYSCSTGFQSPADEGLFGLGCHPLDSGSIDYKGRDQEMLIKYMTGAIPVLLSTKGYGLLWDNYSASKFFGSDPGKYRYVSESGNMVDYYFFYGPGFDRIISLYRDATGRAPMFGRWAFGLFQSEDRYRTQAQVLAAGEGYRKNHIPVDVIVQDWYYWEPLPIGSHVMNPQRYPDPKGMLDTLHDEHLHGMISIWPVFGKGTANYDALKAMGGLTSITWDNVVTHTFDTYYDAHNPDARQLYWAQARDSLVKRYGWDAWWIDQCEPDNGTLLDARRQAQFFTGRGVDFFNTYSLMHTDGIYKGWRKDIPGKRAFFLARQAFAGQQRNASTLWSSDIQCTWHDFKDQVPQGINACAAGIPYWTSDIGGYHFHWQAPDWSQPEFRELFTRWFQLGAFSPIFRIHGKGQRALYSRNWDEATRKVLLNFDNLRYRLLPYIYSLAGMVTQDNYTIMRALAFDFRDDPKVYPVPDQYLFGPAFMVCPVTSEGATSRSVYLPKAGWYDFWTGARVAGGQTMDAAAPIDKLPLYVRAGSILPMGPEMEYAMERPEDTIELRIYPGADGQFTLYEDAGDGYEYEHGAFATTKFAWKDKTRTLTIGDTKGDFPGRLKKRVFNVVIVGEGNGVGEGAAEKVAKKVVYAGKATSVIIPEVKK